MAGAARRVATAVCGMVDCVIDGETGILVRPSAPADLARGINAMLRDRSRARALAERGRRLMVEGSACAHVRANLGTGCNRTERSASVPSLSTIPW